MNTNILYQFCIVQVGEKTRQELLGCPCDGTFVFIVVSMPLMWVVMVAIRVIIVLILVMVIIIMVTLTRLILSLTNFVQIFIKRRVREQYI